MPFEFQYEHDGTLSPRSAIFQAIGAASMCWSETPTGVYDSTRAAEIATALQKELNIGGQ